MNKLYVWIICCLLCVCVACGGDDNDVYSTDLDLNWFTVSSDYDNEIDSLRYEIFTKYQVAVFYHDTIACVDRGERNHNGDTVWFYRILRPDYSIIATKNMTWTEVDDIKKLKPMLKVLLDYTFVDYPMVLMPKCLYLLEEINLQSDGIVSFYNAMETKCVSIKGINGTEQEGVNLRCNLITAGLQNIYTQQIQVFFDISTSIYEKIYGADFKSLGKGNPWTGYGPGIYESGDKPGKFGFLQYEYSQQGMMRTPRMPKKEEDLYAFLQLMFNNTPEEVEAKYSEWPLVTQKYNILRKLWEEIKIDNKNR